MKKIAYLPYLLLALLLCSCRSNNHTGNTIVEYNRTEQTHIAEPGNETNNNLELSEDSEHNEEDENKENREQDVKAIKVKEVEQSSPRGAETVRRIEYNRQGKILRDTKYRFSDGEIMEETINEYDESGMRILSTVISDGITTKNNKYVSEYDTRGRLLSVAIYSDNAKRNEVYYEYDDIGNILIERTVDLETGNQYLSRENTYDSRYNQILSTTYEKDGSIISTLEREYSNDDKLIKERAYRGNSKDLTHEYRFLYDANGNISEKQELNLLDSTLHISEQYIYNDNSVLVALISRSGYDDSITGIDVYDIGGQQYYNDDISINLTSAASDDDVSINYGSNGFVDEVYFKQVDGVSVRYVYEYDDEGYMLGLGYPTGYYYGDTEAGLTWKWYHREFWD